jgi:hypothetical protein
LERFFLVLDGMVHIGTQKSPKGSQWSHVNALRGPPKVLGGSIGAQLFLNDLLFLFSSFRPYSWTELKPSLAFPCPFLGCFLSRTFPGAPRDPSWAPGPHNNCYPCYYLTPGLLLMLYEKRI